MGFNLKAWASHALKVPKSLKKINVGKSIRQAITTGAKDLESGIRSTASNVAAGGGNIAQTVGNINRSAQATQTLPWIIGGGLALVVLVLYMKRGR